MKFLILTIGLLLSLNSFASDKMLKCELFENDQSVRSATQIINENDEASIDLGMLDIYAFGGFARDGHPGTLIVSLDQYKSSESSSDTTTDTTISSTGSIFKITCSIE